MTFGRSKDQVVWLRSIGFEAAFIGDCETSDMKLLDGKRKVDFVSGSPEVLVEERSMKMFVIKITVVSFSSVSLNNTK